MFGTLRLLLLALALLEILLQLAALSAMVNDDRFSE
jgi:hypothetical protein